MSIQEVVQIMNQMTELHEYLLDVGEQKRSVLIHNDVGTLTKLINKESKLIKQITELDQQRISMVHSFLQEKGVTPQANFTVSKLITIVFKSEEKKQLTDAQVRLCSVIDKLKAQNELNRQLIEQSLAYINYTIDSLIGPEEETVYQDPRQNNPSSQRHTGMFDTKA